jgi:hypothetical protein
MANTPKHTKTTALLSLAAREFELRADEADRRPFGLRKDGYLLLAHELRKVVRRMQR